MRVLVLDTGRGIGSDKVATWRSQLSLEDADELVLVSWFPPALPLPLSRHLVCGPVLRLGNEPADWPLQTVGPDREELPATGQAEGGDSWGVADEAGNDSSGGLNAVDLDEQLTEQEADPSQAAAADREPWLGDGADGAAGAGELGPEENGATSTPDAPSVLPTNLSHLPVYDPRRVRQAVRWRRKWAQRRASRFASRQVRRAKKLGSGARHPGDAARRLPSTVVSTGLRHRKDRIAWEFALASVRSRTVNDMVGTADVLVPVDARSQRAAWLLARRHGGPDVVVTLAAAARAVAARRSVSRPAGPDAG